jgi:hypothetical protein
VASLNVEAAFKHVDYISKMSVNVLILEGGGGQGGASHTEFGIILEHLLLYFLKSEMYIIMYIQCTR